MPTTKKRPDKGAKPVHHAKMAAMRIEYPHALHTKVLAVLDAIEESDDGTLHRDALAEAIVELTISGLDYCYTRPLHLAKVNFIVEQTAKAGMTGATWGLASVIRNIIGHMDHRQLVSVCGSVRQMME